MEREPHKVAYFIFNHGVPALFNLPLTSKAQSKAILQSMLEDLMTWHASLLHSILDHQSHPDMANARKLAALDQTEWHLHQVTGWMHQLTGTCKLDAMEPIGP